MDQMLATPADAGIILKLYELRTEPVMREARNWMVFEFWPKTAEEFLAAAQDFTHPQNAYLRQVSSYWEMAAALVLHGAVSADLYIDTNGEGIYLLAKFTPMLAEIRQKMPTFLLKTSELVNRYTAAAQRFETISKAIDARRAAQSVTSKA